MSETNNINSTNQNQLILPKIGEVFLNEPIIPQGNFSWSEATHRGTRIPTTTIQIENIVLLAERLQVARNQIGKPFVVTSWFRPEPFNSKAGGVPNSIHLNGGAVDVRVAGYTGSQLARELSWWVGGMGTYTGSRANILHLDIGANRRW